MCRFKTVWDIGLWLKPNFYKNYPKKFIVIGSLSSRRFWGKRGKMEVKKGESWRRETPDTDDFTGLAELRCLCCYDFAFSETSSESLFEFLSASLSIELPHEIKTLFFFFFCGRWRQGVLWVIQSLPHPDSGCVTRFAEWFCVRPSFLFSPLPPPPPKISSSLAP